MPDKSLRSTFWDQPQVTLHFTKAMRNFQERCTGLDFEMRYIGEELWWPVNHDEVAYTLGGYHSDLLRCLDKMLAGGTTRSPLAEFRIGVTVSPNLHTRVAV